MIVIELDHVSAVKHIEIGVPESLHNVATLRLLRRATVTAEAEEVLQANSAPVSSGVV